MGERNEQMKRSKIQDETVKNKAFMERLTDLIYLDKLGNLREGYYYLVHAEFKYKLLARYEYSEKEKYHGFKFLQGEYSFIPINRIPVGTEAIPVELVEDSVIKFTLKEKGYHNYAKEDGNNAHSHQRVDG